MNIEAMKLALEALEIAQNNLRTHEDNCFLDDEGEHARCYCGLDSLNNYFDESVERLEAAIEQAQREQALDKMAENARELDYEYAGYTQVSKVWWDGDKLMAKPIPLADLYKDAPASQPAVPLTEKAIVDLLPKEIPEQYDGALIDFARAIEYKLKEQNDGH